MIEQYHRRIVSSPCLKDEKTWDQWRDSKLSDDDSNDARCPDGCGPYCPSPRTPDEIRSAWCEWCIMLPSVLSVTVPSVQGSSKVAVGSLALHWPLHWASQACRLLALDLAAS